MSSEGAQQRFEDSYGCGSEVRIGKWEFHLRALCRCVCGRGHRLQLLSGHVGRQGADAGMDYRTDHHRANAMGSTVRAAR